VPTGGSNGSRRLRVVHGRQEVNLPAAERAVRDLLLALGRDPSSLHLADTPRRVAESFTEMLTPREFDLTTFPNDENYDELVLARNIPVQSLCEHHMLPFAGVAHVGYLPGERILGLSKLARVVELFARDLQVVGIGDRRCCCQASGPTDVDAHPAPSASDRPGPVGCRRDGGG